MQSWGQGRNVLIIAHRLSAVRHAQRIIVLDQGHGMESGSHTLGRPLSAHPNTGKLAQTWTQRGAAFPKGPHEARD